MIKNDYEKRRLFEFQAITAVGSVAIGIGALSLAWLQFRSDQNQRTHEAVEAAHKAQENEIVTAAKIFRSVEPQK